MSGMQQENAELDAAPAKLCERGCGFFANPACNGCCSKCYREKEMGDARDAQASSKCQDIIRKSNVMGSSLPRPENSSAQPSFSPQPPQSTDLQLPQNLEGAPIVQKDESAPEQPLPEASSISEARQPDESQPAKVPERPNKPGRCSECNKKISLLTGFKCRCGYSFCATHRLAEQHECDYDYKTSGREHLAKSNPLIQKDKMDRV